MNNLIVSFVQNSYSDNFRTEAGRNYSRAAMCADGLREYVAIAPGTRKFDAVFSVDRPEQPGFFKLIPGNSNTYAKLDTVHALGLYGSAIRMVHEMYDLGYRYVHVEY